MQPIYRFSKGAPEGSVDLKHLLGGKGAFLQWMCEQDAPVPPGFTVITSVCKLYQDKPEATIKAISADLAAHLEWLEAQFGYMPLLSVRSGAPVSMPGMMDTVLNVGLHPNNLAEWSERIGFEAAHDSYYRLRVMFGDVAFGIPRHKLEVGEGEDTSKYSAEDWQFVYDLQEQVFARHGHEFPVTLSGQLGAAIAAVFDSWNTPRAIEYRNQNNLSHDMGTAVTVQAMVFGNMNDKSATGVLFTRNPQTGEPGIMGEYLINAQGEDVVAGIRTPDPISEMQKDFPEPYSQLISFAAFFETALGDAQDMEFTVQDGQLFLLQTRSAKRSARAAIKIGWDLYTEDVISFDQLTSRVTPNQFLLAEQPVLDTKNNTQPLLGTGLPVCDGVATGVAVFSSQRAVECAEAGEKVILITKETTPDDIAGMGAADGILTSTGGATSHAAVVARGMDKVCVVGFGGLSLGYDEAEIGGVKVHEGMKVSLDGGTGCVYLGEAPVSGGQGSPEASAFLEELAKRAGVMITDVEAGSHRRVIVADWMVRGLTPTIKAKELKESIPAGGYLLDLSPPDDFFSQSDVQVSQCAGALDYEAIISSWVQSLIDFPLENVSVSLPPFVRKSARTKLKKAGYAIVDKVDTLEQLIAASSKVEPTPSLIEKIGSASTWDRVVSGLKKTGVKIVEVPTARNKSEILLSYLKETP